MAACEQRQTGRVMLEVETDANGAIGQARILSATPPGLFDQTALTIARDSRLTPAYRDGQPVAAIALLTLFFDPSTGDLSRQPIARARPAAGLPPGATGHRHDEGPDGRADRLIALFRVAIQPVP